ncbi:response regulator [Undibacterium fentianense]|uniref:Sensory/regulatory protein RpfC n=1 Tax=Undibacterium fentianense TaxID=2828728 RepID=A0A941IE02_9BURK|nr:response regulator [Undibacterium fentianense]MBR7798902.1 response regulator [Undibacterium fentianense]
MQAISLQSKTDWLEQSLDALDILRDSIPDGCALAEKLIADGEANQNTLLIMAGQLVRAFSHYFNNQLDIALEMFEALEEEFTSNKEVNGKLIAQIGRVIVLRKAGEVETAFALVESSLIPSIHSAPPRLIILGLNITAILYQERGDTIKAIRCFYRALEEASRIGSAARIAQITANLGEVLYVTGNYSDAEEYLSYARSMSVHSTEKWLLPFNSTMLSLCKIALGKFDEAYQAVSEWIEKGDSRTDGVGSYRSFYLSVAAYNLAKRGQLEEALDFSQRAIQSMDQLEDPHLQVYVWWVSGFLFRQTGQFELAIRQLRTAIDTMGESGYIHLPLCAINELSEIYAELGNWESAYHEQKRYQELSHRIQAHASKIQSEYQKVRSEFKEAEQDRRLNEKMSEERKSLADELQRMLTERETILENSIVGMIFLNSQGRVQWVNTPLCQIFGVERAAVLGGSLEPFYVSRDSYLSCGSAVSDAVLRGDAFETELQMKRADGSLFWVQFSGRAVNKKDLSYGTVWVVMDISARRQLEDDLHRSEYNYRLLIDNVTEGIIVVQNAKIAFANRIIQTLTGYSHEELIGMSFTSSIYAEDVALVVARHQRRLLGESVEQYYQIRLQNRYTQKIIWVEISSVLIEWESQPATLSFVSDLTQRKLLESQLKESMDEQMRLQTLQMQNDLKVSELARRHAEETTAAKSLFLANMSHEIRTPMNAIIGMAHLALKTELTVKQKDYVEKIHKAGLSLMGIINDILDFSKIEAGKLDIEMLEFELDEVLNSVAVVTSEKAEQKGLEYLFDIDAKVPKRLRGDPLRLGQVLINLVNNAIKFTSEGDVILRCGCVEHLGNRVKLRFDVCDTGLGMSETQSAKLFMPFSQGDESTTRKYGGTGLGLSISKGMVELMQGSISLRSELGVGTTVSVDIAFDSIDSNADENPYDLFEQVRILVVDDHARAAKLLCEKLGFYGLDYLSVQTGEEAIQAIWDAEKANKQFDAAFIDLHMPYMDGAELISQIRSLPLRLHPKFALVGATARESLNYREEATITDAYLDKPFNASSVFDCLVNLFSYHRHFNSVSSTNGIFRCRNLHVLLVEDNLVNQQIAKELLEAAEIQVDLALNGKDALARLFSLPSNHYGLVLMDVQMPEMDGHEATKLIRANPQFQELPIIAMTAHAMLIEREKCFDSGMNAHIAKPINPNELYQAVADWCSSYVITSTDHRIVVNTSASDRSLLIQGVDTRLGLSRTMGDRQLYCKLLRLFVHDQRGAVEQIRDALQQGNHQDAERVAHTLKGVAGLIGADIHLPAAKIESQIEGGATYTSMQAMLEATERQLRDVIAEIERALTRENLSQEVGEKRHADKNLSGEALFEKLRACYQLVSNYDGDALEMLSESVEELNMAFGVDVQKQIMRAASQYDFDVIQSIMKGNAHMLGLKLD